MQPASTQNVIRKLRAQIPADRVITDPGELSLYDADGLTIHRSQPGGVVLTDTIAEVQHAVRTFAEHGIPFVARGAGTGLSGGAVALEGAWIIDVNRMRRIHHIHAADRYAVIEPGVVNLDLDRAAAEHGLRFAPDPSSQKACTLGGNVAENSGGPHCFLHGMTTRHILGVTMVLPDGTLASFGGPPGVLQTDDWRGLFIGSEGTFGVAVEIVALLIPRPAAILTALASFPSLRASCETVAAIIQAGLRPAALEILDRLTIRAVEESVFRAGYPREAEAVLLLEHEGLPAELEDVGAEVEQLCRTHGALEFERAQDEQDRVRLWKGRKGAFGAMGRVNTDLYVLDGVVPRSQLAYVIEEIQEIGRRHELQLSNVFHAGDGNLHPNISFDGRDPAVRDKVLEAGREILELCVSVGGTLSGEHGIGMEKKEFMPLVFSDADLATQKAVRAAIDPQQLANPGKIFPAGRGCAEAGFRTRRDSDRATRVLGADSTN